MIVLTAKPSSNSSNFQSKLGFVASSTSWLLCFLFLVPLQPRWLLRSLLLPSPWLPIESNRGRKRLIEESCCMISSDPDWLLLVHIKLLHFRVRPSWLLRSLLLPSLRLPIESNRIESRSKRLIVAFTGPISHHILRKSTSSPTIIARACASTEAVLLTRQSYRQQRLRWRQKACVFRRLVHK